MAALIFSTSDMCGICRLPSLWGDIVACKKLPLDTFFQWNKVYVLDTVQGAMLKRVKKSDKQGYITCVSENTAYEPFDLALTDTNALAIVLGSIRME